MAGIGFALRKLSEQDNLTGRSLAAGHAMIVSSGPWLVTVAGLAMLSFVGLSVLNVYEVTLFRIILIYCFGMSLVVTAPIAMAASLQVSELLYARRFDRVRSVYVGALLLAGLGALISGMIIFPLVPALTQAEAISGLLCLVQISLLWVTVAFIAAIRQYAVVTMAFILGLICSVLFACLAVISNIGPAGMLLGFGIGLSITFTLLNKRILETFPGVVDSARGAIGKLLRSNKHSGALILSAAVGALALWVDKLVIWNSAESASLGMGLVHAPRYDSPLFVAYLSVVPTMSVLFVWLETTFFTNYRRYQDIVHSGGTLRQIEEQREQLARQAIDSVFAAFLAQLGIAIALAILAPVMVNVFGFSYASLSVLRIAFIGSAFHLLFQASCGVILFVQFGRAYLRLQILFLVLNGGLTALVVTNPDLLGVGYVSAAVLAGTFAYYSMLRTLKTLNYLTFIGTNSAIV